MFVYTEFRRQMERMSFPGIEKTSLLRLVGVQSCNLALVEYLALLLVLTDSNAGGLRHAFTEEPQ